MNIPNLRDPLHSGTTETYGDAWFQVSKWLIQKLLSYAKRDNVGIEFANRQVLNYITQCLYNEYRMLYSPRRRYESRFYKDLDTFTSQADKQRWTEDIWDRYLSFHIPDVIFYTAETIDAKLDTHIANDFLSIPPRTIGDILYNVILKNPPLNEDSESDSEQPSDGDEYYDEYDV